MDIHSIFHEHLHISIPYQYLEKLVLKSFCQLKKSKLDFLKSIHNIKSVLSSSVFLSHESAIQLYSIHLISPAFRTCFKTRKSRDGANTMPATDFFCLPKRKKIPMLWTTETIIFIQTIARVFIQRKQPYLWFIANNDRNMLWGHNTDNYL